MIGAYQLTEQMWNPDKHGVDFTFRPSDGLSIMAQLDWKWKWNSRPGHFGLGLNNVSFDMPDFNTDTVTSTFIRYYAQMDQQVTQESVGSDQGLILFAT
jgi:porin|nr:hypothetical protein [uncultured Lamprocystis sp.]